MAVLKRGEHEISIVFRLERFTACMPAVPPTNICHVIYERGITLCPIYYILCYVDGLAILLNRSTGRRDQGVCSRSRWSYTRSAYDVPRFLFFPLPSFFLFFFFHKLSPVSSSRSKSHPYQPFKLVSRMILSFPAVPWLFN